MRLTTKRKGKNVIPLLMAVCGIDIPYWRIDEADSLHRYLSGAAADKLAAYEDAEEQGRLVMLPCKVGDKVRDKIADHIFTIETVALGHKAGMLFRCGNLGTEDYMAFYDFEIGESIEILTREEAEVALKGLKGEAEDV